MQALSTTKTVKSFCEPDVDKRKNARLLCILVKLKSAKCDLKKKND